MPTFSQVLRNPNKKIAPKAAPRRNVQRHAQKATTTATSVLTPESTSTSPQEQGDTAVETGTKTIATQHVGEQRPELTPPATAAEPSPPPSPPPAQDHNVPISRDHSASNPPVAVEELNTRAGAKRKADTISGEGLAPLPSEAPPLAVTTSATAKPNASVAAPKTASRKRRKGPPQAAPAYLIARSNEPPKPPSPETRPGPRRSSSRQSERAASEAVDLLQRSRTGASTVSELARSIDYETRRLRSRPRPESTSLPEVQDDDDEDEDYSEGPHHSQSDGRIADPAITGGDHGVKQGRKRRKKKLSPEERENHEIDPAEVKMGDLTKDSGLGKQSETGARLEKEWPEIKARWDAVAEENRKKAMKKKEKPEKQKKKSAVLDDEATEPHHPGEMQIINGEIVVINREVDQHAGLEARAAQEQESALEDEAIYKYVNQNRIGKKAGKGGYRGRWDEENTDLFYKGLRMFGTDFEMITTLLFPTKSRKEIKDKFVREENKNLARIAENLRQREEVNLDELVESADIDELKDPADVAKQIEADEERLRKQYEEKRAQENGDIIDNEDEADQPIPSIEVDVLEGDVETEHPTARPRLQSAVAESGSGRGVAEEQQKRKKARQPRRTRDTSKAKTSRRGQKPLEGVEEMIGPIEEVER